MRLIKNYARQLGPMGLMPSIKGGTMVSPDKLIESLKLMKQGRIEFRVNDGSAILTKIGQKNFSDEQLLENFYSLVNAINGKRPESIKGKYIKSCLVKTS